MPEETKQPQFNLLTLVIVGVIAGVIGGTFPQWSQNLPPSLRPKSSSTQPERPNFTDDRKVTTSEENAIINAN